MELVKEIRKSVGIKQVDLANTLEINQPNYCKMESGLYEPSNIDDIQLKALEELEQPLRDKIEYSEKELKRLKELSKKLAKVKKK